MSLKPAFDAIQEIALTQGRLNKETLIKKHVAITADFAKVVRYAYDPGRVYGVTFIPWKNRHEDGLRPPVRALDRVWGMLDHVAGKRSCTASEAAILADAISLDNETHILVNRIINKDLECGVGLKTWAKYVIGVDCHEVMLASRDAEKFYKKWGSEPLCYATKLDGVRVWAEVTEDDVVFLTRNGKEVPNFQIFAPEIQRLRQKLGIDTFTLDGEVISRTSTFRDVMTQLKSDSPLKLSDLIFFVFEMPSHTAKWKDKYDYLRFWTTAHDGIRQNITQTSPQNNVVVLKHFDIKREDIIEKASELISSGHEGIVVRPWDYQYEIKRSRAWLKVKAMYLDDHRVDLDLKVIGWEEHTKQEGWIGKLVVDFGGKQVGVGSGFTDIQRQVPPSEYIGKIITVHADSITADGSLRFPTFKGIREDLA